MAGNEKISAMTAATAPLTGGETMAGVQAGVNVKISAANMMDVLLSGSQTISLGTHNGNIAITAGAVGTGSTTLTLTAGGGGTATVQGGPIGGNADLRGGNNAAGAAGSANVVAGNGTTGATARLTAGDGSAGAGGPVDISGGNGTGGNGGGITIQGGSGNLGGPVQVNAGVSTAGNGNAVELVAGSASAGSGGTGGGIIVDLGAGDGAGAKGVLDIEHGTSTTGAAAGTLTNCTKAGDPAGYLQVTINGIVSHIPFWQ